MNRCKVESDRAGLSPAGLENVTRLLDEGLEQELYTGAVVWVARKGAGALMYAVGHTDPSHGLAVDEYTLFDLASLTKPVAAATSLLILCQEGRVHLGQCVGDLLTDRPLPHLRDVTLRQLLTHTSGLPAWKDLYSDGQSREQVIEQLLNIPLEHEPGSNYTYSCLGYITLSLIIERVSGVGLDEFARARVFDPLEMHNTTFNPATGPGSAIAATANCPMRKRQLVGEVHDGNAYALGGVSGNAGLFSCADDLAAFCSAAMRWPDCVQSNPFGSAMTNLMFHNAIPESIGGQSMGWFTYPNDMLPGGDLVSRSAIGHSGFTGTAILLDPQHDLATVFLTNRVIRSDDGTTFRHLRRRVMNAIFGSITL